MRGQSHFLISTFACQALGMALLKDYTLAPAIIGGLASLLTDIDHDQSTISRLIIHNVASPKYNPNERSQKSIIRMSLISTALVVMASAFMYYHIHYALILALFYLAILPWFEHRTLAHCLISLFVISSLSILGFKSYGKINYGIYIGLGYLMHLIEDTFTKSGIKYFYPFSKKSFKIPLMSTGTPSGNIIECIFIIISFLLMMMVLVFGS